MTAHQDQANYGPTKNLYTNLNINGSNALLKKICFGKTYRGPVLSPRRCAIDGEAATTLLDPRAATTVVGSLGGWIEIGEKGEERVNREREGT